MSKPVPRLPPALLLLTLGGAWLVRSHSETWWWVSLLDLIPPQLWLPLVLWAGGRAARQRAGRGWVWSLACTGLTAAALLLQSGWTWARPASPPGPPTLSVLSFNADFASAPAEAIAGLARREGADVVLLQEALDRQRRGRSYEAALRRAFPGWGLARHDELLTLSRWPLEAARPVTFPHSPHALLLTRLNIRGQVVRVYNAHLVTNGALANASDTRLGRTLAQRVARRLAVRRDFLALSAAELRQTSDPVLFAGDFNASPRGELAAGLRALGLTDAFAATGRGFGFTHAAQLGHSRIDYVWGRGFTAREARALPDKLSDHRALLVRF